MKLNMKLENDVDPYIIVTFISMKLTSNLKITWLKPYARKIMEIVFLIYGLPWHFILCFLR